MHPKEALGSGWGRYSFYRGSAIACTVYCCAAIACIVAPLSRVLLRRYSVYRGAVIDSMYRGVAVSRADR